MSIVSPERVILSTMLSMILRFSSWLNLARIFHQTDELNFAAAKVGKEMPMTV